MKHENRVITLGLAGKPPVNATRQRLERGFVCLENIRLWREEGEEPPDVHSVEEGIVWRELIDLELQDVDERIRRISDTAGRAA